MSWARGAVTGAVLCLAALAAASPAFPGDPPVPLAEVYEKRLSEARSQVGMKFDGVASFAESNGMRQSALDYWRIVLEFLPDHPRARRTLGFVRDGTSWKSDEARVRENEALSDLDIKKRPDLLRRVKEAQVFSSRCLGEAGDLAKKAGLDAKAREHWRLALSMDSQNPGPNRQLGHAQEGGRWWSPLALAHRDYGKRVDAAMKSEAARPIFIEDADPKECSEAVNSIRSRVTVLKSHNYRIESTLPEAAVKEALRNLEHARAHFVALFGLKEDEVDFEKAPHVFVVVHEKDQHDEIIQKYGLPEFDKKFSSVAYRPKLTLVFVPEEKDLGKALLHTAAHTLVGVTYGGHAPWLFEALANSISAPWTEGDLSVCFSGAGTTGGISLERISVAEAPLLLKERALAAGDRPFADFVGAPPEALRPSDIAKSWSLVQFLLERDPQQAAAYFTETGRGDGNASKDGKFLRRFFKDLPDWAALDAAWREWVLDVY